MDGRRTKNLVVLWLVWIVVLRAQATDMYCTDSKDVLRCVYKNTSQTVRLDDSFEASGAREVRIESASALQGVAPCNLLLQVWSSNNVTLEGGADKDDQAGKYRASTAAEGHASGAAASQTKNRSTEHEIVFVNDSPKASSVAKSEGGSVQHEKEDEVCLRNVSAHQSKFQSLRGRFDCVTLRLSEAEEVKASFTDLFIWSSSISRLSAVVQSVSVEETTITLLSTLKVENQLKPDSQANARTGAISLKSANIKRIEREALKLTDGRLHISNTNVDVISARGIVVANGSVTFVNSHISQMSPTALVLQGNSSASFSNCTIGKRKIKYLMVSSNGQDFYPLQFMFPAGQQLVPRIGSSDTYYQEDLASADSVFRGFKWYWVAIMLGIGLVAGVVLGAAARCKSGKETKQQNSSLTLSDLISRDRMEERDNTHENEVSGRPNLHRQDSGLTSSSFASYTACQDRGRLSCLKQPDDLDQILNAQTEPNIYVQVSPLACAQETVIYEEAEAFTSPKGENTYLTMAPGTK
ncbi:uncharacterized protein LOC122253252 [Penaeus japonicus]|uniref:uncharacterized protein LOC122253252 n=1 Tax=Penaeus japonicus TaxID=27405 RepID=UPI001C70E269|nr:uncharacterized protein LOC122253252 [Penaeus japonicus]